MGRRQNSRKPRRLGGRKQMPYSGRVGITPARLRTSVGGSSQHTRSGPVVRAHEPGPRRGTTQSLCSPCKMETHRERHLQKRRRPFPGLRLPPSDLSKDTGNFEISLPSRAAKQRIMDFRTERGATFPFIHPPASPRAASGVSPPSVPQPCEVTFEHLPRICYRSRPQLLYFF